MDRQPTCETHPDGTKEWLLDGKLHRTDGPAIERTNGSKVWYLGGNRHRTDGPAFEGSDGRKSWYLDGKRHRTDGPAYEWPDGGKEWWLDGQKVPWQQVYHRATSDEARVAILNAALTTS